jgi:hypothetical protein
METSSFNAPAAFIQDGEVGPLPRADTATLGAYLGNSDLVLLEEPGAAAQGGMFVCQHLRCSCACLCLLWQRARLHMLGA